MSNIFNKKTALIDSINTIRESVSKEYADEHKAKAMAARNSGKMSDYHKHMSTHHDHLATHFTDKGDSRAADLHMNKATEHEAKAKEVSEAKLDSVKPHELKKDFKDRQDKDIDNDGKVDSSDEYLHKRRQAISQKMKSEGFSDKEIDALLEYEMSRRADGKYVDDEGNVMSKPPSRWASKKVTSNMYRPGNRSSYRPSYGKPKNEEVEIEEEQIDELSKKTLGSYAKKATDQANAASSLAGQYGHSRGTYVFSKEPQDDSRKKFAAAARDVANKRSQGVKKAIDRLAKEEVEIEESQLDEAAKVPSNISAFAKRKGSYATALVKTAAQWAGKAGKRIVGGTAIGKYHDTIILDLTHHGSEVYIDLEKETIKVNDKLVTDANSFAKALGMKESIEVEESQLDELSKKTLGSYVNKASRDSAEKGIEAGESPSFFGRKVNKINKRLDGIRKATSRLTREEVEIEEAEQFAGWIAHHNGKKLEIRKHEAKDLYDAKQKAIAHFKPKKSQKHMVSVKPAYEEVEIEDVQESGMTPRFKRTEISKSKYEKLRDQMHSKPKKPTFHMEIKDGHNVSQFSDESGAVEHWHHLKTGKVTYKRVSEGVEYDIQEQSDREEKHEMAQTQAHFIKYAAEEIIEYIEMGGEIEEWYQNKLSKVHSDVESLHSYMEGEKRRLGMAEEVQEASLRKSIAQISGSFPERSSVKTKSGKSGTVLTVGKDFVKVAHGNKMKDYKPSELTKGSHDYAAEEFELDERNKENATRRKMMDASRGARYKVSGNPVPDRDPEHKTGQDHNKAIGRALRKEEADLEESNEISPKQNMLLRAMATDPKDINKMRRAIKLGDKALMNPVMRQEILRMLDQMMDVSLNDPTIFAKTRQIFKKRKATDTTNTE